MSEPREVAEPNLKDAGPCGCGMESCTAFGTLKRPNRDGTRCVARQCACKRCQGRNNRSLGMKKQRKMTKGLGLSHGQYAGTHEEALAGPVRTEAKADAKHAKPVATAYDSMRAQADAAKSVGDNRPFVASTIAPGSNRVLYVIAGEDLAAVVFALAETWGAA